MAPNIVGSSYITNDTSIIVQCNNGTMRDNNDIPNQKLEFSDIASNDLTKNTENKPQKSFKSQIVWRNVVAFLVLHSSAIYGLYLIVAERAVLEVLYSYALLFLGGMGITAGAHRLWSHRAYKAKLPLRIFLMVCNTLAFQNSIYEWTRDHRVHHKYTDTDADPHNSKRGFFFAHMGWLMCRKHPDVKTKGKLIDMSDLNDDPVVMFQKRYYLYLMPLFCFVLPSLLPYYAWGAPFKTSFFICAMLRYTISLHGTWLVNSAAHFYGIKPYDKSISPVNSKFVSRVAFGEGWHNYHHVFPWDYKAAELGNHYNITTAFLNLLARFGQAYEMKTVSEDMLLKRIQRTGDGSHPRCKDENNNPVLSKDVSNEISKNDYENLQTMVWGWEDKDVSVEDRLCVNIVDKKYKIK